MNASHQLRADYTAKGWSFTSFFDESADESRYHTCSPRLLEYDEDFVFDFAALHPVAKAMRDESEYAQLEDALRIAEAHSYAQARYVDAVYRSLSPVVEDIINQLALLHKRNTPDELIPSEITVKDVVVNLRRA